ncbi:MAG: 50S ribosomal protein L10 [Bacteroidaceae bacterium]|nr:50S ribosomal protein L10 [Bacteroidaceae bacterium]
MRKEDKAIIIEQLGARLKEYPHLYLVDVTGLNAEATSNLRRKCFATDVKMIVTKNTLLEKAFDQAEMDYSPLKPCLKGTTALFLSNVANAPAKLIKEFGKDGIPALKGAYAEEGFYVGAENLATLCAIKSKNEVIGDIIGLLQSPLRNILSGLEARFDKEEGAAE